MITMEMLGKVKRLYSRDKKSLHEIAKTTGLSRNTIRKWVRGTDEVDKPSYRRKETANKLTAFHQALELALKADSHRTKQNRRTAKALFVQIKADGYAGGYSRVTDFIRAWRDTAGKAPKAFVPLAFEPGEAFQFDWSDEAMVVGGIFYKLQVAHLKLCFSRAFWLVAYPSQGHEMLFDAQGLVDPVPLRAIAMQFKQVRVITGLVAHDQLQQIPTSQGHVRQRLAAQRVFLQDQRPVAHFSDVMLVHVKGVFEHRTRAARRMRLHIDRIHVVVAVKRKGKARDGGGRVLEGEIVAKRLILEEIAKFGFEIQAHLVLLSVQHKGFTLEPGNTGHDLGALGLFLCT